MIRRGRPMKYADWIRVLDNETIYAASSVVRFGEEKGLFEREDFRYEDRIKVRNSLNQFASNHFAGETDGIASTEAGITLKGWYGWRWKTAIPSYYFDELELDQIRCCKGLAETGFTPAKPGKNRAARQRQWPNVFSRKMRPLVAIALAMGTFALGTFMTSYSEGLRILSDEGPRAALEYFRAATFKRTDYKAEFGQAWSKYVIGDFTESEADCYRLMQQRNLPDPVRGNCYYLLGYIQMRTLRLEMAKESFESAGDIYQKYRKWPHLYQTSLALGEIAMEQGYLDEAEANFQEAFAINRDVDRNLGHYYHLQAQLAFRRENFERALQMARKSLFDFQKNGQKSEEADVLADIGFYLVLLGDYSKGYEITMEAQELIQITGNNLKYYFNLVNLLLLKKCSGEDINPLKKQIQTRIDAEGEIRLQYQLDLVLDWDCLPERTMMDDEPIPTSPEMGGAGTEQPPPDGH